MNTHNWSNDFRDLLGSMGIQIYSTALFVEIIDAYSVTRQAFNSAFRTRYKNIDDIRNNADYYAKKAPYLVVDDRERKICSFVGNVSDIIEERSQYLICKNTTLEISLPARYAPKSFEEYLAVAEQLKTGNKKERLLYKAYERYFNRIDLILHHLNEVDLAEIADSSAECLHKHME